MTPSKLIAAAAITAGLALALALAPAPAAEAKTTRPYEAIAGHYPTMKQANAVAARARSKGFKVVVQPNRCMTRARFHPLHIGSSRRGLQPAAAHLNRRRGR